MNATPGRLFKAGDTLAQLDAREIHARLEQALAIQHEAESLLAGREFAVDSRAVLRLVKESQCSAYDCEYVALAEASDAKLVTMDGKLLAAFPSIAVALA